MPRSGSDIGAIFRSRRQSLKLKQKEVGVSDATARLIEAGKVGPQERSTAVYAEAVGWPADAWQRLLEGADPATLTSSPSADSGLDEFLSPLGRLIDERTQSTSAAVDQLTDAVTNLKNHIDALEAQIRDLRHDRQER